MFKDWERDTHLKESYDSNWYQAFDQTTVSLWILQVYENQNAVLNDPLL